MSKIHVQSNGTLLDIRLFLKTETCVCVLTEIIIYSYRYFIRSEE